MEMQNCLEQERGSSHTMITEIYQQGRLASFAGQDSSNILSPDFSWNAINHPQLQKGSKLTVPDQASTESSSKCSGRATSMTAICPLDLQSVRDQMVVALKKLKEMEEQVKIIPMLQVKISVLKKEKKQLTALVEILESRNLASNLDLELAGLSRERSHSTGKTVHYYKPENKDSQRGFAKNVDRQKHNTFKQHNTKMCLKVGDPEHMAQKIVYSKCFKHVATETKINAQSVEVGVTECMLGVVPDTGLEFKMQQKTIQVLRDKVQTLEVELKEALLEAELHRTTSKLQKTKGHAYAFKKYSAQPEMQNVATQTGVLTRTVGIGNHIQSVHVAVGDGALQALNTVGVTCQPETRDVASGLDIAFKTLEVQKKMEIRDQCVGTQYVPTTSRCVCDVSTMTLGSIETLIKTKPSSGTVGCADCTIDVSINMVKPLISQGFFTEPVRGSDLSVIMTPPIMSQHTNTNIHAASCYIDTSSGFSKSSSILTNTLKQQRRTLTAPVIAGTPRDQQSVGKMCYTTIGAEYKKTDTPGPPKVMTRDIGVGLVNINENFLIGLRTRNMACGPSRLPDPAKTRSIGVEVGDGRIRDVVGHMWMPVNIIQPHFCTQSQSGLDLVQKLLNEQQSLLTSNHKLRNEVTFQHTQHEDDNSNSRNVITKKNISQKDAESKKTLKELYPRFECLSITEESLSDSEEKKNRLKQLEDGPKTSVKSKLERRKGSEMSDELISAFHKLKAHLNNSRILSKRELCSSLNMIQLDWFCVSSQKKACPQSVESFLSMCHHFSPAVLTYVVNMADQNGNTALHYSVSHSNFKVVQKLLDAGVCNVNQQNKAGYTPIMLAALAAVEIKEDMSVVEELFRMGDVNAKASQAGQTALMMAVSHGRMDMVKILLDTGSKVNIQDEKGSTALMCASDHGHVDIVRLLLAQAGCDATLSDNDSNTAMSIALNTGHNDIAMLLYAHINYGVEKTLVIS